MEYNYMECNKELLALHEQFIFSVKKLMVPTESTKKITCKDGECQVTEYFEPMRKYSRTGFDGKLVKCPHCESTHRVYHLRDKTMTCSTCKTSSDKYQWMIEREVIYSSY